MAPPSGTEACLNENTKYRSRNGVTRFSRSDPAILAGPFAQPIRTALSRQAASVRPGVCAATSTSAPAPASSTMICVARIGPSCNSNGVAHSAAIIEATVPTEL